MLLLLTLIFSFAIPTVTQAASSETQATKSTIEVAATKAAAKVKADVVKASKSRK